MRTGVTQQRSGYFDDSSASLGLRHDVGKPGGDPVARFAGPLQQRDLEERAVIAANVAADREKRVKELQRGEGWTRRQAEEFVDREAAVPKGERPRLTPDEKRIKAIEHDMGIHRPRTGHGSGSKSGRRKRSGGCGTWTCPACKLEYCPHRPTRRSGPKVTVGRALHLTARVSPETADALAKWGLGASDFLEVAAIVADTGVAFVVALARFRASHPCRVCPDSERGIFCVKCSSLRSIPAYREVA